MCGQNPGALPILREQDDRFLSRDVPHGKGRSASSAPALTIPRAYPYPCPFRASKRPLAPFAGRSA